VRRGLVLSALGHGGLLFALIFLRVEESPRRELVLLHDGAGEEVASVDPPAPAPAEPARDPEDQALADELFEPAPSDESLPDYDAPAATALPPADRLPASVGLTARLKRPLFRVGPPATAPPAAAPVEIPPPPPAAAAA